MLILAIDTALDACAAGVLDSDAGSWWHRNRRHEARSCRSADAADRASHESIRHWLSAPRPHRGDHRSRQLHRLAGRTFRRARHCARRRQAGGRRHHADGLCCACRRPERRTSGDLGDRCAARPCVFSGGRRQRKFADQAAGRADRGGARRIEASARRIWSAMPPRCWPTAGRRMRHRRSRWMRKPRPTSAGWRGWARPSLRIRRRRARIYLRAPDAKPPKDPLQKAAQPSPP